MKRKIIIIYLPDYITYYYDLYTRMIRIHVNNK